MHVPLTAEEQEKLDYLLGAFGSGTMRPPRVSIFYGLGLVAVLAWWVVTAALQPPVLGDLVGMAKYAGVLSLGPIVLFFMVKP